MLFLFLLTLISCATGSVIVTGKVRKAIDPSTVILYSQAPANYEIIALVEASSDIELSSQKAQNRAIAEIKKQAAKVGANGVIIIKIENVNNKKSIHGKAVFVNN